MVEQGTLCKVMTIIKRYPNRKLYNTESKQYVTLAGIAGLIRHGGEVQILDHSTGEDLTAVTLTQIILEQEKKEGGFLPRAVLTGLVQSGGQTLSSLRRALALPLGFRHLADQEIERRVERAVELGHMTKAEGARVLDLLLSTDQVSTELASLIESEFERLLGEKGIPTKSDIQQLDHRLEQLVAELEILASDTTTV